MANVTVTPQAGTRAAWADFANKTAATSGNNYLIANDGNTRLLATSSAGATLTVATPGTVDGLAITDLGVTLEAGKTYVSPTFPAAAYGTTLTVTVSANTDLMAVRG